MAASEFLVVGAGPVGLAMAKALTEAGVPYVHCEATDHVGGNWAHGVYETAHIISSRTTTEYPDHPMPKSYPTFPSAAQMRAYYEDYATTWGLKPKIRFDTPVVKVTRSGAEFLVEFGGGRLELFKGLFVCNGHHWKRHFPAWVQRFEGEVLHSKDYKGPEDLRGKRVLVIGGGNSGCDLVSEAARVGRCADWSLRRGYWFLPKSFAGRPTVEYISPWVPVFAQRALVKAIVRTAIGRYEDHGLPKPDHRPLDLHPTLSSEVFHYLGHGRIRPRPDVEDVEGRVVRFVNGAAAEYDVVACGTGFDVSFPFLPEGMVTTHRRVAELIGGALVPGQRHLYIVGAYQPRYGLGPVMRPYAQMLAQWAILQDELEVPLADVLVALGQTARKSEVVDPHQAIREARLVRWADPILRWQGHRMERAAKAQKSLPWATQAAR